MKHMDLFCASPASTAICSSMDKRAIVRHRTRPIGRSHMSNPDPKKTVTTAPCISQLPFDPKSLSNFQRSRKSSAKNSEMRRKSSANIDDMATPPASPRFLLNDNPVFETLADSDNIKALIPNHESRAPSMSSSNSDKSLALKSSSTRSHSLQESPNSSPSSKSSSTRSRPRHQVVELMVSLHCICKGCEGKLKRHISRMQGVTSFSIDMESKKVTIIGDVTPLEVLASVSKVKSAKFWPSPASSSSSSTPKFGLVIT